MMKKLLVISLGLLLFYSCKEEKKEETAQMEEIKQYSIEQFMDNENAYANGYSPDKSKVLMTSNRSGIYNMYTVPANGGEMTQLTKSDSASVYGISYFPEDDRILFRMDGNGDEIFKLYVKDSTGTKALTPTEKVRALFRGWAKDGKSFFYGSNERDSKYMDHYEMDIETFTPKIIYKNEDGMDFGGMSEDRKHIALGKSINTNDSDLYILNTETGKRTKINDSLSGNSPQDFSPDGTSLYYTTDADGEYSTLMKYNIAEGTSEKVAERDWDITGFYFTHNGTYQLLFTNEDAETKMEVKEVASGDVIDFPEIEGQSINSASFSRDETIALLRAGGSHTPTNSYSYNLETKELNQLTDVLNDEIDGDDLVSAEVIRFKSFDGLEIPAIYYQPKQATAENKVPALVWVHGGPGGQSRQGFNSTIQYLVNHGYAVLAVNNRGSSGYGKSFYKMDDQNHGDKDLKDCIAGKDWLAEQDVIDGNKIGIIGGSYGGYMTMAALTYAPEEFDVGVNIFGVTNWLRTLKSIPPWWESFKEALYTEMGDPNTADSVRLREISPLFHTDKVTKPLMVLQGAQDPRVLQVESDEIVAGVKKNGVPVEYVLFEDEGHGFVKKENQIEAYGKIKDFLDKYLKGEGQQGMDTGM
ncbi:S9 family peptidase [Marixanthomonas ophiurae]|uniref:S9 family peptidase n=1 Tax=Marixanthomonas ophiurae TaxID=387659 RepID=A0A3E1QDF9_9FLAO|nr:S9 family peptidase [Marixanthomonas ophiurae]RFN60147.1 S9 family peptidase [Marixanthomonas ophiurae]